MGDGASDARTYRRRRSPATAVPRRADAAGVSGVHAHARQRLLLEAARGAAGRGAATEHQCIGLHPRRRHHRVQGVRCRLEDAVVHHESGSNLAHCIDVSRPLRDALSPSVRARVTRPRASRVSRDTHGRRTSGRGAGKRGAGRQAAGLFTPDNRGLASVTDRVGPCEMKRTFVEPRRSLAMAHRIKAVRLTASEPSGIRFFHEAARLAPGKIDQSLKKVPPDPSVSTSY